MNILRKCNLCPRNCNVDRYKSLGFCKANNKLKIALYSVHKWEEPCISGTKGSGTIFFSNCNLKCVYCQNRDISEYGYGKYTSINKFSEICLLLQEKGVHNINLVTPTHYVPLIIKGLKKAKTNGLNIPIVYNTSSYENVSTIKLLNKYIDIYLADLKYYSGKYDKYSNCNDYFKYAIKAIDEMYKQVGKFIIDKNGIMQKGLIVRILLLPGNVSDAKILVKYLYDKYKDNIYISLMNQYTIINKYKYDILNRKVTKEEYDELVSYAISLGIKKAFIQDGESQSESFIPNFKGGKNE